MFLFLIYISLASSSIPQNEEVLNKICHDFEEASKADPSLLRQYPEFSTRTGWDRIYGLVLSRDAWIKGAYEDIISPSVAECGELIHNAGGIALLAHYFTISRKISLGVVKEWMEKGYLDGAETLYNMGISFEQKEDPLFIQRNAQRMELREMCKSMGKIWFVGGGDIHTMEHLTSYANSPYAEEGQGMTEKLVERVKDRINLKVSSSLLD